MTPALLPTISKLELSRVSPRAYADLTAFIRNHLQILVAESDSEERWAAAQEFLKQLDQIFGVKEKLNGR